MKMTDQWNEIKCPRTDSNMYQFKCNLNVSFQVSKDMISVRKTGSSFGKEKLDGYFTTSREIDQVTG